MASVVSNETRSDIAKIRDYAESTRQLLEKLQGQGVFSRQTSPGSEPSGFSDSSRQTSLESGYAGDVPPPPEPIYERKEKSGKKMESSTKAVDFEAIEALGGKGRTVQHYVFNWLNWAPEPGSDCYETLHGCFPGAMPGIALHDRVAAILTSIGFTPENTLLGISICPDEINNEEGDLSDLMKKFWGESFPLGGISGAPFVGQTGFTAFSHHVPDNGNIIILFGPHVAISEEGGVGKYLREGQHHLSTACGAVIGAYKACCCPGQNSGDIEFDELDMQMAWIKAQLAPHADKIGQQKNPMAALAFQAYEMVRAKLEKIVNTDFGSGRLVLIGGLQINMPKPFDDHFMPMMFKVLQNGRPELDLSKTLTCDVTQVVMNPMSPSNKMIRMRRRDTKETVPQFSVDDTVGISTAFNDWQVVPEADFGHLNAESDEPQPSKQHWVFSWLNWSPQPKSAAFKALHRYFPNALPGPGVHHRVATILKDDFDFTPENTIFGASFCPDEINHMKGCLEFLMAEHWGEIFPMGGISGAPFVGKTGFKAFSHHVPDDGNIIIIYGPHVAISDSGEVGKYLREGQSHHSTACGAVIGAYNACLCKKCGDDDDEFDEADMQMGWIKSQIMPHAERIKEQQNPMVALAYQAFESVRAKMNKIVNTDFGSGRLVILGGIQINMPQPCKDHFLPMVFDMLQDGHAKEDLMEAFSCPLTQEALEMHHQDYHYHHNRD